MSSTVRVDRLLLYEKLFRFSSVVRGDLKYVLKYLLKGEVLELMRKGWETKPSRVLSSLA